MAYNDDLGWIQLTGEAGAAGRVLKDALIRGNEAYNEWQSFRNSRTDAQIAAALGRTEAEIAELDSCFAAFKETYDFANNVASPTQGDRLYSIRKFS